MNPMTLRVGFAAMRAGVRSAGRFDRRAMMSMMDLHGIPDDLRADDRRRKGQTECDNEKFHRGL
jgi:hypothetical protein